MLDKIILGGIIYLGMKSSNVVKFTGMVIKTVATNRKAYHNYSIGDTQEAGIALTGSEIKSIRSGRASLGDAYVRPERGELWLLNAHIARYEASSYLSHEPRRPSHVSMAWYSLKHHHHF